MMNKSELKHIYGKIITLINNKIIGIVLLTTEKGYIVKYKPTYLNFPTSRSWSYLANDEYAQENMIILKPSIQ